MRLIILSPADDAFGEHGLVGAILRRLPVTFHLRKPDRSASGIADYLEKIPADLHPRIMIHGHADLQTHFDLMGVHFTERERLRRPERIRQLRREWPERHVSSAFHRIPDIPREAGLFDYLLLSPIFDSLSKPGYRAAFRADDLRVFLSATAQTVVALGGVDMRRIAAAAALGFSGVAVLGAVWGAPDPCTAAEGLWAQCRSL